MAAKLLAKYEFRISALTLIPSDGGRFEVSVNDRLVYSKLQTGRHANEGEVEGLVGQALDEMGA